MTVLEKLTAKKRIAAVCTTIVVGLTLTTAVADAGHKSKSKHAPVDCAIEVDPLGVSSVDE